MRQNFILAVASAVALVGGILAAAAPAQAAAAEQQKPCVTQQEYRAVKVGMTKTKVASVIGQRPDRTDGANRSWYSYCSGDFWTGGKVPTVKWTSGGKVESKALKPAFQMRTALSPQ